MSKLSLWKAGHKKAMPVLFQHEADPHLDSRDTISKYLGVNSSLIKEDPAMTSLLNLVRDAFGRKSHLRKRQLKLDMVSFTFHNMLIICRKPCDLHLFVEMHRCKHYDLVLTIDRVYQVYSAESNGYSYYTTQTVFWSVIL